MNECARGLLQAALGVPVVLGLTIGAGLGVRHMIQPAEAASLWPAKKPAPAAVTAGDALTVYTAGSVEFYSGRFDVASTHARRVEMHADGYSGGAGSPPAGMLDDGYEVTVYAADGVAFTAEDCALLGADAMGGGMHWYMRCD